MAKLKKIQRTRLATVNVILAIPATQKINDAISSFVRSEFGEGVVLEISVKPEILGGAILIFEGFYRDYSLLTKLTEAFETKRPDIASLITTDQQAD